MSDAKTKQPTPDEAAPAAQAPHRPPMSVLSQYTKDFSFENPGAPQSLAAMTEPPTVEVNVNIGAEPLGGNNYEVALTIGAAAKNGDSTVFVLELIYGGVFALNDVPEEHVQPALLIEAPRLLFPFARNIIADATRDGGFPPLMVQPFDFAALYQRQLNANASGD